MSVSPHRGNPLWGSPYANSLARSGMLAEQFIHLSIYDETDCVLRGRPFLCVEFAPIWSVGSMRVCWEAVDRAPPTGAQPKPGGGEEGEVILRVCKPTRGGGRAETRPKAAARYMPVPPLGPWSAKSRASVAPRREGKLRAEYIGARQNHTTYDTSPADRAGSEVMPT